MTQRIPQPDVVRGIAILLVLVHNLNAFTVRPFSYLTTYGWMGVDLFFVLSGFLITGILLDSKQSARFFTNFYARRCLRIWPLYYVVFLSIFVVLPLLWHQQAHDIFQRAHPWWSYFFYLQNFFVAQPLKSFGALGVTWSLAVEELFYLVWPLFVRFLGLTQLRWVAWCIILGSPALRLFLSNRHVLIYSNPFCRLDGMMAGALLALYVRKPGIQPNSFTNYVWAMLVCALCFAIASEQLSLR
jgi:peptidoglycan/LPS O-acetylase OafA/YrhL